MCPGLNHWVNKTVGLGKQSLAHGLILPEAGATVDRNVVVYPHMCIGVLRQRGGTIFNDRTYGSDKMDWDQSWIDFRYAPGDDSAVVKNSQ